MRTYLLVFAAISLCVGIAVAATQERDDEKGRERGRDGGSEKKQDRNRDAGPGGFDPERIVDRIFENDKNKDNKISKDEADQRLRQDFANVDTNEDGFVTKEEMRKRFAQGPPPGGPDGPGGPGGGGPGGGGPGGPGGGPGGGPERLLRMMPVIQALDTDKDGEISEQEIENASAALKTLDKNKDGKISIEEMTPYMSRMFGGPGGPGTRPQDRGGAEEESQPKRPTFEDDVEDKE